MKRKMFSFLLVLSISVSIVGCGNASAKSESASGSEAATANFEKVETENVSAGQVPAGSDEVAAAEAASVASAGDTTIAQDDSASNYTGSLYTLPVGSVSEKWTEEQLDQYLLLKDDLVGGCIEQNESGMHILNLDKLMDNLGYDYVGFQQESNKSSYLVYWRQVGNVKIAIVFTEFNDVSILVDDGSEQILVEEVGLYDSSYDGDALAKSVYFSDRHSRTTKTPYLHIKGVIATLCYMSELNNVDCARLPYPAQYRLATNPSSEFVLSKSLEFMPEGIKFQTVEHPYE